MKDKDIKLQQYRTMSVIFAIAVIILSFIVLFSQPCVTDSYNHYAGEWECVQNCGRLNSIALHTFSYDDERWHCTCEGVASLW